MTPLSPEEIKSLRRCLNNFDHCCWNRHVLATIDHLRSELARQKSAYEELALRWTADGKKIVTLESRLQAAEAERDEFKRWRDAIDDAAVVNWTLTSENKDDPRKAINSLLVQAQKEALDPAISEPAEKLHAELARTRQELAEQIKVSHEQSARANDNLMACEILQLQLAQKDKAIAKAVQLGLELCSHVPFGALAYQGHQSKIKRVQEIKKALSEIAQIESNSTTGDDKGDAK